MKREVYRHPKTLDLASRLNIPTEYAAGLLGAMWDWCADMAPQGNIGKWPNAVIARALNWPGDADEFVQAFVDSEWLDRDSAHRLIVHDLRVHAPNWWHAKLNKLKLQFVEATQEPSKEASIERSLEASQVPSAQVEEGAILPTSSLPTSANLNKNLSGNDLPGESEEVLGDDDEEPSTGKTPEPDPPRFAEFWAAYPKRAGLRRGRKKCVSLWRSIRASERDSVIRGAANFAKSKEAREGYARDPERWLRDQNWIDWQELPDEAVRDGPPNGYQQRERIEIPIPRARNHDRE